LAHLDTEIRNAVINNVDDLARIPLRKKAVAKPRRIGGALVVQFVDRLLAVARR